MEPKYKYILAKRDKNTKSKASIFIVQKIPFDRYISSCYHVKAKENLKLSAEKTNTPLQISANPIEIKRIISMRLSLIKKEPGLILLLIGKKR